MDFIYNKVYMKLTRLSTITSRIGTLEEPLSDLPHLAFDHYDIMQDAIALYKKTINNNGL